MSKRKVLCNDEDLEEIRVGSSKSNSKNKRQAAALVIVPWGEADSVVPHPIFPNPESNEERQKRLAKRKAKTLKTFQLTYKNRRKKAA